MKNFKVGERVAFTYNENRYRGEIECICGPYFEIKINETIFYSVQLDEANIKRLVKKKRLTFWINIYSDDIHAIHNTKESAKSSMKIDGFIRTAKFVEVKESK